MIPWKTYNITKILWEPKWLFCTLMLAMAYMLLRGRFMESRFLKTSSRSPLWNTSRSLQPSILKSSIATGRNWYLRFNSSCTLSSFHMRHAWGMFRPAFTWHIQEIARNMSNISKAKPNWWYFQSSFVWSQITKSIFVNTSLECHFLYVGHCY